MRHIIQVQFVDLISLKKANEVNKLNLMRLLEFLTLTGYFMALKEGMFKVCIEILQSLFQ